jgi:hypothetical protein
MVGLKPISLALLSAGLIASLSSGCGNGSSSSSSSPFSSSAHSSSSSINSNDAGFYGDNVYFGDQKIVGEWLIDDFHHEIYSNDGTLIREVIGQYRNLYPQYGINEDGTTLTVIDEYYKYTHYTFKESDNDCFTAIKEASVYWPVKYCKYVDESVSTLNPISNAKAMENSLGFYGNNVQFGNETIIEKWGFVPIEGGDGGIFEFDESGNGTRSLHSDYAVVIPTEHFKYGISENGKELTVKYNQNDKIEIFQIVGLFEGCYKVISQEVSYKYCKME